jgi:hypothetical protein
VHDGVDPAQRVAEAEVVLELSKRDLHPHPLGAQSPRIAHQAAHRHAGRSQPAQQRRADRSGGSGE